MGEFSSKLLELAAFDDLQGFKLAIEQQRQKGHNAIDDVSLWYGRRVGSRKMGLEERTPLMVAAMYGSKNVLNYILSTGRVDVNRVSGTDGATALHCAASSGSDAAVDIVKTLLSNSANSDALDCNKKRPSDVIPITRFRNNRKMEPWLSHERGVVEDGLHHEQEDQNQKKKDQNFTSFYQEEKEKHEYPLSISLPDINNEIFGTDEFRMYSFKIKPCSRAYSHDWTECPFAHPGENAKRRDPRKFQYSCVPCPDFRKGSCAKAENCEFSHGIFESWLHPAQYRTRLCKDGIRCSRKVCFFAHKMQELRPLYASTGSAIPPTESYSSPSTTTAMDVGSVSSAGHTSPLLQVSSPWRTTQSPIAPPRSKPSTTMISTGVTNMKPDVDLYSGGVLGFQSNNKSPIGTRVKGQSGNQLQSFRSSYNGGFVNSSLSANSQPFSLDSSGSSLHGRLRQSYTEPYLASHKFESLESFGFDEPDLSWVQSLLNDASSSEFLINKVGSEQMVA